MSGGKQKVGVTDFDCVRLQPAVTAGVPVTDSSSKWRQEFNSWNFRFACTPLHEANSRREALRHALRLYRVVSYTPRPALLLLRYVLYTSCHVSSRETKVPKCIKNLAADWRNFWKLGNDARLKDRKKNKEIGKQTKGSERQKTNSENRFKVYQHATLKNLPFSTRHNRPGLCGRNSLGPILKKKCVTLWIWSIALRKTESGGPLWKRERTLRVYIKRAKFVD